MRTSLSQLLLAPPAGMSVDAQQQRQQQQQPGMGAEGTSQQDQPMGGMGIHSSSRCKSASAVAQALAALLGAAQELACKPAVLPHPGVWVHMHAWRLPLFLALRVRVRGQKAAPLAASQQIKHQQRWVARMLWKGISLNQMHAASACCDLPGVRRSSGFGRALAEALFSCLTGLCTRSPD